MISIIVTLALSFALLAWLFVKQRNWKLDPSVISHYNEDEKKRLAKDLRGFRAPSFDQYVRDEDLCEVWKARDRSFMVVLCVSLLVASNFGISLLAVHETLMAERVRAKLQVELAEDILKRCPAARESSE